MGLNFGTKPQEMLSSNQTIAGLDDVTISSGVQVNEDVSRISYATAWVYLIGESGETSDVSIYFQRSPDGDSWFDTPVQTVVLNGDTQVSTADAAIELDIRSTSFLKVDRIVNANASAITVNVEYTPQRIAGQA